MTYAIPPDSPKAARAAAFGRELVKARTARSVSRKELHRVTGIGLNSLGGYEIGANLPKVEAARTLAETLRWPRLAEMIVAARTFTCQRTGCGRTYRNDTGAPRKFCSAACVEIHRKLATAARSNREAGREGAWSSSQAAAVRTLRAGLRLADERNQLLGDAIGAMCAGCEPEGLCRSAECPLRPFSPLPLARHEAGEARTEAAVRADSWTPERRDRYVAALNRRWADPANREATADKMRQWHAAHPEHADAVRAGVKRRGERRRAVPA